MLLLGDRRSLKAAWSIVILTPLVRVGSYYLFPGWRGSLDMMLHTAVDSIMVGCVLALILHKGLPPSIAGGVKSKVALPGALVFLLFVSPLLTHRFKGMYLATMGYTLDAVGAALIILHASVLGLDKSSRPCSFFAATGFHRAIVLRLVPVATAFLDTPEPHLERRLSGRRCLQFWRCLGSHCLIERPFLRLKRKFQPQALQHDLPRPSVEPAH